MSVQRADSRGNIIEVARLDAQGTLLTKVGYEYNALSELVKAIDPKDNCIWVSYDMLGRRTALESLDSGRQEFFYDASSNLIAENTSVLKERNRQIEYSYDGLNRLVKIQYPDTEDTVYTYGGSSAKNGAAGRILSLRDASGSLEYAYGALGEVINFHLHCEG